MFTVNYIQSIKKLRQIMATVQAQASPTELGPEIQFSVYTGKNTSSLTITPALRPHQINIFQSTLAELVREGVLPEQKQPTDVIGLSEGVGKSSRRSTLLIFPNFEHEADSEGEWRGVHAENAATIISSVVALDRIGTSSG